MIFKRKTKEIFCQECNDPIPRTPECYIHSKRVCTDCYKEIYNEDRDQRNAAKNKRVKENLRAYDEVLSEEE